MDMDYLKFSFITDNDVVISDLLTYELGEIGFDSFDEEPGKFNAYIPQSEFKDEKFDQFISNWTAGTLPDYTRELIKTVNWNKEWESNYQPIEIDQKIRIIAPFHTKSSNFLHEIVIKPKMSFGTGHHETTRMVVQKMSGLDLKNKNILDMGTGTGVLAIYAERLGASSITAIDIEDFAYENAIENCNLNNANKIHVEKGGIERIPETLFYCILANINKNILLAQIPTYSNRLEKDGILLLSGFFVSDVTEITNSCLQNGMKFVSVISDDNWACAEFRKE